MKGAFLHIVCLLVISTLQGQESYSTRQGLVQFNASTPLEDIEAVNQKAGAVLVPTSGEFAALLLIREFDFPRALMQEHFNENYMESDRFPKAILSGSLDRPVSMGPEESSEYTLSGTLEIHGVAREVEIPVALANQSGSWVMEADFVIRPEDHDIEVPRLLFTKIAREVQVEVSLNLRPDDSD